MTPIYRQYGNSNYLVSCFGTIRTKDTFKLISQRSHSRGYLQANLSINGKKTSVLVHRITAMLWTPNPKKRKFNIVNHLDLDKTNNFWTNFEWTDVSGNTKHAVDNGAIDMNYVRSFKKK